MMTRWPVVLTTVMVVVGLASLVGACGDGDGAAAVFSFETDELCEWIDAETVERIVEDAYTDHGATPIVSGFRKSWGGTDANPGCGWSVPAPDSQSEPAISSVFLGQGQLLDEALANGAAFNTHPALPDGVTVDQRAQNPIGAHGDWVAGLQVAFAVEGHDHTLEYSHDVPPDFNGDAGAILAIADGLVQQMGWVPVQGG